MELVLVYKKITSTWSERKQGAGGTKLRAGVLWLVLWVRKGWAQMRALQRPVSGEGHSYLICSGVCQGMWVGKSVLPVRSVAARSWWTSGKRLTVFGDACNLYPDWGSSLHSPAGFVWQHCVGSCCLHIEIRLNKGKSWVVSWKEVDIFDDSPHK